MRHPIEKYNQIQAEELAKKPEEEREFWARMNRIGNAAYCYQFQFNEVANTGPSEGVTHLPEDLVSWLTQRPSVIQSNRKAEDLLRIYFEEYLEGLPNDRIRQLERTHGLEEAKRSWPFRRYVLERNDFGMNEFMRLNLSTEDYDFWIETTKP